MHSHLFSEMFLAPLMEFVLHALLSLFETLLSEQFLLLCQKSWIQGAHSSCYISVSTVSAVLMFGKTGACFFTCEANLPIRVKKVA